MRKSLVLFLAGALLVVWGAFSDLSVSQSPPPGKTAPSGTQTPPSRESHSKIKMERERCLACHDSLPRDMNDPVYKKCDLYNHCSVCHGSESGMGDGPAAPFLYPKPRDFSRGLFKLRSTTTGEPPTEHDLFKVITRGIPGSAMPTFAFMTDLEKWALSDHVKTLGRVFEGEGIKAPPSPPVTPNLIQEGQKVYEKLKCAECHGDYGAGDGTASSGLKDDWGHSISPNDLTRGIYKGGEEPQEVYLRVTGGMNGTPMPSYLDSTTPEERWALVAFLLGKL
ncbi:MAG: c-type cytochrome, partial [Armatimonadetes bacterium]|nr:c-type cytochrome [Armatimonadota bacterium]